MLVRAKYANNAETWGSIKYQQSFKFGFTTLALTEIQILFL